MRRDQQRLQDILDALDSVAKMIAGRTEAEFLADEMLCYAVVHQLTVVIRHQGIDLERRHNDSAYPPAALAAAAAAPSNARHLTVAAAVHCCVIRTRIPFSKATDPV